MTPKTLNCWGLLIVLLAVGTAEVYSDQVPEKRGPEQGSSKFSCEGRQSGFYADVSSGCQLYHMCDEGGRVFTHTCPERTRFQQRTMVCDHWYMVECDGVEVSAPPPPSTSRLVAASATASTTAAAQAQGGPPARKRHSQRVFAHFPYRRGNETVATSTTIQSSETLGRFKISSIPSSTQRTAIASTATIERVPRPTFFSEIPKQNVDNTEELDAPKFGVSGPIAKVERVSKESVSPFSSFSPSFVPSPSFREAKVGNFFTSTEQPSTERVQSATGREFNNNPFLESYFRTSLKSSPTTSTTLSYQTTTQGVTQQEDEDDAENKLEIVVPDLRKMFYIPETNFHSSESLSIDRTVLVIELPPKNSTKFKTVEVTEAKNHDCPHCHPSYIISGTCEPLRPACGRPIAHRRSRPPAPHLATLRARSRHHGLRRLRLPARLILCRRRAGGRAPVHGGVPAAAGPRPLQDQRQLQDVGGSEAHVRGRGRALGRDGLGGGDGRRHQHAGALRDRVHPLRLLDGLLPPGRDRAVDHRDRMAGGRHGHRLHGLDVRLPQRRARRRLLETATHHQRARTHQRGLHQRRPLHLREELARRDRARCRDAAVQTRASQPTWDKSSFFNVHEIFCLGQTFFITNSYFVHYRNIFAIYSILISYIYMHIYS